MPNWASSHLSEAPSQIFFRTSPIGVGASFAYSHPYVSICYFRGCAT